MFNGVNQSALQTPLASLRRPQYSPLTKGKRDPNDQVDMSRHSTTFLKMRPGGLGEDLRKERPVNDTIRGSRNAPKFKASLNQTSLRHVPSRLSGAALFETIGHHPNEHNVTMQDRIGDLSAIREEHRFNDSVASSLHF